MPVEVGWAHETGHPVTLDILLLGPGYGESLIARIPPGVLLVVDCFRSQEGGSKGRNVVLDFLESRHEPLEALLLTHPHEDHAQGLGDLVQSRSGCLVGCCEPLWITPYQLLQKDPDLMRRLAEGACGQSLAAIRTCWGREPSRRWSLEAGSVREVGEARLTVLHPTALKLREVQEGARKARPNALSSPILLEWRELRLLLGADLESSGWPQVHRASELRHHHGFKVAHHASKNAFHRETLRPTARPPWFTTPWSRAGQELPNFKDRNGVARILGVVDALLLTSLPFAVPDSEKRTWGRSELLRATAAEDPEIPGARVAREADVGPEEGWLALAFEESGSCSDVRFGGRAVTVHD